MFERVKRRARNFITIRRKGYGVKLRIPKPLREKYFSEYRLDIFVDRENKLLGLQPHSEGAFKIYRDGSIWCSELGKYKIKPGTYQSNWSGEYKMLIAEIEFE